MDWSKLQLQLKHRYSPTISSSGSLLLKDAVDSFEGALTAIQSVATTSREVAYRSGRLPDYLNDPYSSTAPVNTPGRCYAKPR
jgi:hypothetical protein